MPAPNTTERSTGRVRAVVGGATVGSLGLMAGYVFSELRAVDCSFDFTTASRAAAMLGQASEYLVGAFFG